MIIPKPYVTRAKKFAFAEVVAQRAKEKIKPPKNVATQVLSVQTDLDRCCTAYVRMASTLIYCLWRNLASAYYHFNGIR